MQISSKYLLAQSYLRRITSAEQLIPLLEFVHYRSVNPTQVPSMEAHVPLVRKAVERYLRGTGHPFPQRAEGLADPAAFEEENNDPNLRSRRFVKALSGLDMLTNTKRNFTVCCLCP